jgi:hypothetical protein
MNPRKLNNYALFTEPIDGVYEDQEEITVLNLSFDFLSNEDEDLEAKKDSNSNSSSNISCFSSNFSCFSNNFSCFSSNFSYRNPLTKEKIPVPVKPRRQTKFKFKYILQPKWEETISKMKTHWFLSAKNRIIASLWVISK